MTMEMTGCCPEEAGALGGQVGQPRPGTSVKSGLLFSDRLFSSGAVSFLFMVSVGLLVMNPVETRDALIAGPAKDSIDVFHWLLWWDVWPGSTEFSFDFAQLRKLLLWHTDSPLYLSTGNSRFSGSRLFLGRWSCLSPCRIDSSSIQNQWPLRVPFNVPFAFFYGFRWIVLMNDGERMSFEFRWAGKIPTEFLHLFILFSTHSASSAVERGQEHTATLNSRIFSDKSNLRRGEASFTWLCPGWPPTPWRPSPWPRRPKTASSWPAWDRRPVRTRKGFPWADWVPWWPRPTCLMEPKDPSVPVMIGL